MASYHVFIERPRESGGDAVVRLAEAVAARYGLPAPKLIERLGAGRLRVKASVDRATAQTFATDLESLGAVCSIVDAETGAPLAGAPLAAPAPSLAPPAAARPRPAAPFASGLSAASGPSAAQDLGALASGDFALATLDGKSDAEPDARGGDLMPASFGPPADALPASMGPAITPVEPERGRPGPPAGAPIDLFAPPDAAAPPPELALDVDPRERRGGTTAPATPPPAVGPVAAAPEAMPPPSRSGVAGWIRDRRIRLAAGVLVAILVGFVPATVVASLREASAFQRIQDEVTLKYESVESMSMAEYRKLDAWRATQLAHKRDVQHNIALGSMAIWALAGGLIAFLWFRKVDWDGLADRFD